MGVLFLFSEMKKYLSHGVSLLEETKVNSTGRKGTVAGMGNKAQIQG